MHNNQMHTHKEMLLCECVCHIVLYIIAGTARAINRNVVREKQQLLRKRACNVHGPSTSLVMACGIRIIWQSMRERERERVWNMA